jgi:hypothetical protein
VDVQRDKWAFSQLAREANKNVFDLRSRLYLLLAIAVLIGLAIPLYAAWQSQQLMAQLDQEASQGRNVVAITALRDNAPAVISRASCEALSDDPDVERSGLLEHQSPENFPQLGAQIPVAAASITLLPELARYGSVVGDALRQPGAAFSLIMPDGSVQKAITGKGQPDAVGTNSSVVVGLSPSVTGAPKCLVVLSPLAREPEVANRLVAQLISTGGPLAAQEEFSEPRNPIDVFLGRPDRYLPLLLALAGALTAGTMNRLRSGEWAAFRMSGTSTRSLLIIQVLEQANIAGCLALVATLTTLMVSRYLISPTSTILISLAAASVWIIGSTLVAIDLPFRKPTNLAKDR